jgi:hypothetical protein
MVHPANNLIRAKVIEISFGFIVIYSGLFVEIVQFYYTLKYCW